MTFEVCRDVFEWRFSDISSTAQTSLFFLLIDIGQLTSLLIIVCYLQYTLRKIERGVEDREGTGQLIFPLYMKLLYACCGASAIIALTDVAFPYLLPIWNRAILSILYGLSWSPYHFVIEGVAFLLMARGVGAHSTRIAMIASLIWSCISFVVFGMVFWWKESDAALIMSITWSGTMFLLYLTLLITPTHIIYQRPALRQYVIFWVIARAAHLLSAILRYKQLDFGYCLYDLGSSGILSIIVPWVVYRALLRDCRYWRGVLSLAGDTAITNGTLSSDSIRAPLLGTALSLASARELARVMDGEDDDPSELHMLNCFHLHIDKQVTSSRSVRSGPTASHVVIGAGSTSRVFRGTYKRQPVAIKMIFVPDLTPSVVSNLHHEARLLAGLNHPNVCGVFGLCVLPPSVCLVLELCPGGNVFDHLRRPGVTLTWREKLRIACDMSRAVAYLHAQSPPVLHLDLKSLNFLIAEDGVVKVADLEMSRELVFAEHEKTQMLGSQLMGFQIPDTINWLAPELLTAQPYSEKADVYSLAMCIYEVLTGLVPFDGLTAALQQHAIQTNINNNHNNMNNNNIQSRPQRSVSMASPAVPRESSSTSLPVSHSYSMSPSSSFNPTSMVDAAPLTYEFSPPLEQGILTESGGVISSDSSTHDDSKQSRPTSPSIHIPRVTAFTVHMGGRSYHEETEDNTESSIVPATASLRDMLANQARNMIRKATRPKKKQPPLTRFESREQLRRMIVEQHYRPILPRDTPEELADLIRRGWHPDASQRPTAGDFVCCLSRLLQHISYQRHI